MSDELQPDYTDEQVQIMNRLDEIDKVRTELSEEWAAAMRQLNHRAHFAKHRARQRLVVEIRGLLEQNIDEYKESVQEKVEALLEKYGVPTYPVIFTDNGYHGDYTEEKELELTMIPVTYRVYHLTAKQKEAVLKYNLSELELSL